MKPTPDEQKDILELLHRRRKNHRPFSVPSITNQIGMINAEELTVL